MPGSTLKGTLVVLVSESSTQCGGNAQQEGPGPVPQALGVGPRSGWRGQSWGNPDYGL